MDDDINEQFLQILSWTPLRDPRLLDDEPLLREMHKRIAALGLDKRTTTRLFLTGWVLTDLQRQGRAFERNRGAPLPRQEFSALAGAARKLLDRLQSIDKEVEVLLAMGLDDQGRSLPRLKDELQCFLVTAEDIARTTKRHAGRQEDHATFRTVTVLAKRYQDLTGNEIGHTATRNSISDPHLNGIGGRFITEWFDLIDPTVTAGTLFRLWPRVKKRIREGSAELVGDLKSVDVIELGILRGLTQAQ